MRAAVFTTGENVLCWLPRSSRGKTAQSRVGNPRQRVHASGGRSEGYVYSIVSDPASGKGRKGFGQPMMNYFRQALLM